MVVRIYRPAKTAMQSGVAQTQKWVLEHERETPRSSEPLMGWTSASDTKQQLKLTFDSKDEATAYAKCNGLAYRVSEPKPRKQTPKSYSDNFKFGRVGTWTH